MKRIILIFTLLFPISSPAQEPPGHVPIMPLWDAPIPSSQGFYSVSLNSVCSVALEKYDLEFKGKTYPVVECSVETVGGKTARFYYVDEKESDQKNLLESMKDTVTEASGVQGAEDDQNKKLRVVKVYPESSTSTTVEFRLATEKKVVDLYQSLRQAWVTAMP